VLNLSAHGDKKEDDEVAGVEVSNALDGWKNDLNQKGKQTHRTRIGQKTGMSKTSNKVMQKATAVPLTTENLRYMEALQNSFGGGNARTQHQNFSSGRRRWNGRNSPLSLVGSTPASG
jgi:hypothetical protein